MLPGIYPKELKTDPENLQTSVLKKIIHNSPNLEATKTSFSRRMSE